MSNGASLQVNSDFLVGPSGSGTFNQTGGNATASAAVTLGGFTQGTGTVNLSGGSLTTPTINVNRASVFNQTGGTLSVTETGTNGLFIGNTTATARLTVSPISYSFRSKNTFLPRSTSSRAKVFCSRKAPMRWRSNFSAS